MSSPKVDRPPPKASSIQDDLDIKTDIAIAKYDQVAPAPKPKQVGGKAK